MTEINYIKDKVLSGEEINKEECEILIKSDNYNLFTAANQIREHFIGREIILCSIVNAKSGFCSEDCSFCGQSSQFITESPKYKLLDFKELKSNIDKAYKNGASEFSFVTSGRRINTKELELVAKAIKYTKENTSMEACSSLGLLTEDELNYLKDNGMDHYHHNVETSRSHFSNIISSHTYDEEINTIRNAKNIGLHTCCGGIFGLGESWNQRLELAFDLRDIDIDTVPINFLNPIKGTILESQTLLKPFEALKIVAIFRFIFPTKNVMVMGGRERVLRDFQSWIFFAGANGMLLGNYLTTKGRSVNDDLKMIEDLGLIPKTQCHNYQT
ncbi:MAG: biotin synthase BioB [Spirochaetota bacterium]|nr:biotin synthase BioB [Spirochaetota bacterium]